jgi:hypothetical protein
MLTYLWDFAVAICIEDISNDEDAMGAEEKGARWQVGDGRVHILIPTIAASRNLAMSSVA